MVAVNSLCSATSEVRFDGAADLGDVDRWRVAQLVDQGYSYCDIREMTEVSVTTIGRVARYIEQGTGGYRTVLDRLDTNRT